ncbi:paREP7 [Pyrobaculum oguniense TE7]|uniref:PaREP7 n=1 Tax=Pyrobaculum oguniense (strain DSM 13380 / JCM 10595 / TE7) TaxID=698757 RepID=H6Q894_PYROT|nr:paREP7 [Pyrobaculum oguniense TE7]
MGLKEELLRLLREDEEFRYAVAGLLSLGEVLAELKRLREDFNKFVEESQRRWEENNKRWEENNKRWEENEKRWAGWFETWKKFLEDYFNFKSEVNKRFSILEENLGALTEAVYTRYVWEDLSTELRASGEAVVRRIRNADFDGVEVDLLVETEKRVYVVEVKVRPRIDDVGALLAKAEIVGSQVGKPAVPVLAGSYVGREVEAYARGKGVLVFTY